MTVDKIPMLSEEERSFICKEYDLKDLYIKYFEQHQAYFIIAIHNTSYLSSLGGCRLKIYPSLFNAVSDAARLAKSMSYKSAIHSLPFGGGKAVIMPISSTNLDRKACFEDFGKFVNELKGQYITAIDVGVSLNDLNYIAANTTYITGMQHQNNGEGNPSILTAYGVRRGIEAAVYHKTGSSLKNIHVAIQGVGSVGYCLAKELHSMGAKLTVCDVDPIAAEKCRYEFSARVVAPNEIYQVECDVFSPCGVGLILNAETIPLLNTSIIAGAANNQLKDINIADNLFNRNILLAPDYVINSGGLLFVSALYQNQDIKFAIKRVHDLYYKLIKIFTLSSLEKCSPYHIANKLAEDIFMANSQ